MVEEWFKYSEDKRNKMKGSFTGQVVHVLLKVVFILEPLIPFFAAYFLNRQLKSWEQRGLIINRRVQVQRMARFYYKINVHFVLSAHQAENILNELMKVGS